MQMIKQLTDRTRHRIGHVLTDTVGIEAQFVGDGLALRFEPIITLGQIGKHTIAITNSTIYMFVAVGIVGLLMLATGRQLVPGRMQSIAEISYEFVASPIRSSG